VARAFLGWQHAYGDINPAQTLAFASGGIRFDSYGVPLDRNSAVAEAGLDWRATSALSLGLAYTAQIGPLDRDNAIKGRAEYRF
jgi:fibronectin-binding autotransporter adhesin